MNIVVLVKHSPDVTTDLRSGDADTIDRPGFGADLSEQDKLAVELALEFRNARAAEDISVTVLTVGPEAAAGAVRKAIQMGADAGVHVVLDAISDANHLVSSLVLAKALERIEAGPERRDDAHLVVCGMASTDASNAVVSATLVARLGSRSLPVLAAQDETGERRHPSYESVAIAGEPLQTWSLTDIGVECGEGALSHGWAQVDATPARPRRSADEFMDEDGSGPVGLVEFLAATRFLGTGENTPEH